jgi:F0F1-type ATP synthase assembly protein I
MSQNSRKSLQKAIGASYSVLGALALFGFGGYWLDRYRGSENLWLIIGLLLGVVIGLYELSKYILKK